MRKTIDDMRVRVPHQFSSTFSLIGFQNGPVWDHLYLFRVTWCNHGTNAMGMLRSSDVCQTGRICTASPGVPPRMLDLPFIVGPCIRENVSNKRVTWMLCSLFLKTGYLVLLLLLLFQLPSQPWLISEKLLTGGLVRNSLRHSEVNIQPGRLMRGNQPETIKHLRATAGILRSKGQNVPDQEVHPGSRSRTQRG